MTRLLLYIIQVVNNLKNSKSQIPNSKSGIFLNLIRIWNLEFGIYSSWRSIRNLSYIPIILLFVSCGSNPSDDEKITETNHSHESHAQGNTNHHHEDEADDTPADDKGATRTSTYDFDPGRYNYKDGHIILTWEELAKVTFEEDYHEEVEEYIFRPIFSDTLKALNRKKVMVEGFVIPIEETGDETFVVLSGLPYLQCFFCGGAGPETVIDILPKSKLKKRLTTDEKITFKGRLRLNADDLDYLNYILDDAELVD